MSLMPPRGAKERTFCEWKLSEPMTRALFSALFSTILFGAALLGPMGAWSWHRAWVLVGIHLLVHGGGAVRVLRANPSLLLERAKLPVQPGQPLPDKVLLLAIMASYAAELMLTGAPHRLTRACSRQAGVGRRSHGG